MDGACAVTGDDPFAALAAAPGALVLLTGTEGAAYRSPGAAMAVLASGARVGSLSGGCIDGDIAAQAAEALAEGRPRRLRYGAGSPFIDLRLPCGGALEVLILPRPNREAIGAALVRRERREEGALLFGPQDGAMAPAPPGPTGWQEGRFRLRLRPELRFLIFGEGPEARAFARLAGGAGYPFACPEAEAVGTADARTAVVLFFHDHDREIPILAAALAGPAVYVGAQGSRRAAEARRAALREAGVPEAAIARLRGPAGLIPSARDPRILAISVLAEAVAADAAATRAADG